MAVLLENITNYVWHAFDALQMKECPGFVHKTKLKVLTANIGTILDIHGVERGLEHHHSTPHLNFDQYKYYLQKEMFSSLPTKLSLNDLRIYEASIAEICWLLCRTKHLISQCSTTQNSNRKQHPLTSETTINFDDTYQLFRIFCVLAELVPEKNASKEEESDSETGSTRKINVNSQYRCEMHREEVVTIATTLATNLGKSFETNLNSTRVNFDEFLTICVRIVTGINTKAVTQSIGDAHQTIVEDVIKKGTLLKRGYIFPAYREYWFELRPDELAYYRTRTDRERCGTIPIESAACSARITPTNRIALRTSGERVHEFDVPCAMHMARVQWHAAFLLAIEHSDGSQGYQRVQVHRRRLARSAVGGVGDRAVGVEEVKNAQAQLEKERDARKMAEVRAKQLQEVVQEDSRKLDELEKLRERLMVSLEEETRARQDEEIVRGLQARVLTEEWEKREELEGLQRELKLLLELEREKRVEFEELQKKKEEQLNGAEERLKELELEKINLDKQLKLAHNKMKQAEDIKEILEAKLNQMNSNSNKSGHVRRAHSFMPSTKERPTNVEVRASTLRRIKKE